MKLQRYMFFDDECVGTDVEGAEWRKTTDVEAFEAENAALHAECDRLTEMLAPQQPMSAEEVTETGIFKGLADSIWIMGAQFGWECCEANDKDRFNHAINTQDFPIAVQVPLKAPEV